MRAPQRRTREGGVLFFFRSLSLVLPIHFELHRAYLYSGLHSDSAIAARRTFVFAQATFFYLYERYWMPERPVTVQTVFFLSKNLSMSTASAANAMMHYSESVYFKLWTVEYRTVFLKKQKNWKANPTTWKINFGMCRKIFDKNDDPYSLPFSCGIYCYVYQNQQHAYLFVGLIFLCTITISHASVLVGSHVKANHLVDRFTSVIWSYSSHLWIIVCLNQS